LMGYGESGCRPAGRHIQWFDRFSKCVCPGSDSVYEYTLASAYATQSTVVASANYPFGLYFDSSNNLYVVESRADLVIEYVSPGYSTSVPVSQDIICPAGIAGAHGGSGVSLAMTKDLKTFERCGVIAPGQTLGCLQEGWANVVVRAFICGEV